MQETGDSVLLGCCGASVIGVCVCVCVPCVRDTGVIVDAFASVWMQGEMLCAVSSSSCAVSSGRVGCVRAKTGVK